MCKQLYCKSVDNCNGSILSFPFIVMIKSLVLSIIHVIILIEDNPISHLNLIIQLIEEYTLFLILILIT